MLGIDDGQMIDPKELMRIHLRTHPQEIVRQVRVMKEVRSAFHEETLSPTQFLAQWGFEEPEITELLKKAGYIV